MTQARRRRPPGSPPPPNLSGCQTGFHAGHAPWLPLLLLGLAVGCASTRPVAPPAAKPPAAPEKPAPEKPAREKPAADQPAASRSHPAHPRLSLEEAARRELAPLPKRRLEPPAGNFSGEVEAAGELSYERSERFTVLSIPLGTESPLLCFIYEEPLDAGSSLLGVARALAEDATLQRMTTTEVLEVAGAPALFLQVDYSTRTPSGAPAVGQVKLMVHVASEHPILCAHDEPGYSQAFRRITTGLSASVGRKPVAARYSEIQVVRYGGSLLGFEWREMTEAEHGLRLTETVTSLLLPTPAHLLDVEDSTSSVLTDASGRVEELSYAKSRNGAVSVQLSAHREGTAYPYEGVHAGRPMQGTFHSKRGLTTALAMSGALRERLLSGQEPQLTFELFEPWVNPGEPVEAVYRRAPEAGPRAITITVGASTLQAQVDAQGLIEEQQLPLRQGGFRMQRLSVSGAP